MIRITKELGPTEIEVVAGAVFEIRPGDYHALAGELIAITEEKHYLMEGLLWWLAEHQDAHVLPTATNYRRWLEAAAERRAQRDVA